MADPRPSSVARISERPGQAAAGMSPHAVAWILVATAAVAAAYSLSPLSVIFAAAMVLLFRAAVTGLSGTERTCVLGALGTALAVRLLALVVIYVTTNP